MLSLDKIYHAKYQLKGIIRQTDMIHAYGISEEGDVYLKTENLQTTGSFKLRGAFYKISQLTDEERAKGIVACSAGNHAQGVALAAKKFGAEATIFMPDSAPISKIEATKSYGAKVVLAGGTYDDAYKACLDYRDAHDMTFIHPFNDPHVISGQGTIGLEILKQLPQVDNVILPVGGGGLLAGVAFAIKQLNPRIRIIGVEPKNAASMKLSLEKGKITSLPTVNTFADGIAVKVPGEITFDVARKYVDEIVTVTDDEIATAILTLMEKQKLVCEGAGVVPVAALLFHKFDFKGKVNCAVLSGGNIDVNILSRVISRGLLKQGRTCSLRLALTDKPGQLELVSGIIAKAGANVIGVFYDQGEENTAINSCILNIRMETRNEEHILQTVNALKNAGFQILEQ